MKHSAAIWKDEIMHFYCNWDVAGRYLDKQRKSKEKNKYWITSLICGVKKKKE